MVAVAKTFTPSAKMFPLSGYANLRTVQDARRYLGATRALLAQVRNAPSGVPYEVRMPLGDAWFQVNVGLSLCDDYIRLGRTWFDAIDEVDGLREALQGLVRAFAHARPAWQNWDKERTATDDTGKAKTTSAASTAVVSTATSAAAAVSGFGATNILNTLSEPTPSMDYVGLGIVSLAALLLWQVSK
jgi:hypothetical protein